MKKILLTMSGLALALVLSACGTPQTNYDEFANCLTEKGVKMYGTDTCIHCIDQKEMFGDSFAKVDYINCDLHLQRCLDAGVEGTPTWELDDGVLLVGTQPLEKLAEVSNCELPSA